MHSWDMYSGYSLAYPLGAGFYLKTFFLCCLFCFLVVFSAGAWAAVPQWEDPELQQLASCLPNTVLQCRADSTSRKYLYAFKRWMDWAGSKEEVVPFPAKPMHIALYLQYLVNTVKSKSATSVAVNALAWAHRMAGMESPTENSLVRTVVDALDRSLAQPKTRKEPVTAAMLEELVEKFGTGRL